MDKYNFGNSIKQLLFESKIKGLKNFISACLILISFCNGFAETRSNLLLSKFTQNQSFFNQSFSDSSKNSSTKQIENDSLNIIRKKRLKWVIAGMSLTTAGTLIGLNQLWYANYPKSKFQFFDDSKEWNGMDKAGHFLTNYYITKYTSQFYKFGGLNEKNAVLLGAATSFVYMTSVEIMDGHSAQWGFSNYDFAANTLGMGVYLIQKLTWNEEKIIPKFSFYPSEFAKIRPELLGKNITEQWLKDYNGQTYWLSFNLKSIIFKNSNFPPYLNLALGYGATGMIGAFENPTNYPIIDRYSQYYLSLDIDLNRIQTKNKFLKGLFQGLNLIKIPFPNLEFNKNGVRGNWL